MVVTYRPASVLVTGGAGFIGSNFVHRLLGAGNDARVIVLDRLSTGGDERNLAGLEGRDDFEFVHGDINDQRLVAELLRSRGVDTIVHLAAETHVDRSIADPLAFADTNVTGTLRLLQVATACWLDDPGSSARRAPSPADAVRFHHVSTDEVYGSLAADDAAFTEATPYAPRSPYAASKAAADHLVRAWFTTYGLPVTITNCSNNFGPRQHREKLLPTVIRSCLAHEPIPVYGDGSNRRDWLYVDDHCEGLQRVLEHGVVGETYHLGGDNELSNNELIARVCSMLDELAPWRRDYATLVTYVEDRPGHDWRYAIDTTKARTKLGWAPRADSDAALRATCEWYLTHRERLG